MLKNYVVVSAKEQALKLRITVKLLHNSNVQLAKGWESLNRRAQVALAKELLSQQSKRILISLRAYSTELISD